MNKKILVKTPRLIITAPDINDFKDLYELQSNSKIMTFIGNGIRTEGEVLLGLKKAINHQEKHNFSLGSVFLKNTFQFIGRAGLIYKNYDDQQMDIEIAYAFLPNYWGQGYATEIAQNLITWAHTLLQNNLLVAVVNPDNIGSKNVLAKCGMIFSRTEHYNDKPVEVWNYLFDQKM